MAIYEDIRDNNKNRSLQATKTLIKNQRIFNIMMMIFFGGLLIGDILYLVKGNIVGMPDFSRYLLITSIILEGIIYLVLVLLKFNNENMILKVISIIVFSLPVVSYLFILKYGEIYSILLFVLRIVIILLLVFELIKGRLYKDSKVFKLKYVLIGVVTIFVIFIATMNISTKQNRRIDYSYDNELDGYCVDNVLEGSSDIEFKENTVKLNANSMKNCNSRLDIPESVVMVDENAFKDSNVSEVHITSKNITIMKALENSNVKNVYLDSSDVNIVDISSNSNVKFITSKDDIDSYRDKYSNCNSLFVPNVDSDEYYVVFNGTNKKIEYYKKNSLLEEPKDVKPNFSGNYKLLGFYNGDELVKFPISVNSNIELTCKWSLIYNISLNYNDGNLVNSDDVFNDKPTKLERIKEDGDLVLPKLMKDHYHFDGWYSNDKLVSVIKSDELSDIELSARFSKIYKLNYHENGGYIDDDEKNQEYIEGNIITPATPTRIGYKFVGWYDNPEFNGDKVISVDKEGIDLYAKWEIITYKIIYITDGFNLNSKLNYTILDNYTLLDSTRTGFVFNGWYSDSEYVNKVEVISNSYGDLELYAKFTAIRYNISYHTIGTNLNSVNVYTIESEYELIDSSLDGYLFMGWYKESNYLNKISTLKGQYGDLDLYAKFEVINYSISYHSSGVNPNTVNEYNIETDYLLKDSILDGYDFVGWYKEDSYVNKVENLLGNYGNLELYGRFSPTTYSITYHTLGDNPNSGRVNYNIETDYDLIDSERVGYEFKGWYKEDSYINKVENLLGNYSNLDLYAKFELINYDISYHTLGNNLNNILSYNIETDYDLIDSERVGYEFKGWYKEDSYVNKVENLLGNYGSLDLYAKFIPNKYVINYDANGGVISNDKQDAYYDSAYQLLIPVRTGYRFDGWRYGTDIISDGVWNYLDNINLVATWTLENPSILLSEDIDKVYDGINSQLNISISHPLEAEYNIIVKWYILGEESPIATGKYSYNVLNAQNNKYYCHITISHKGNVLELDSDYISVNIKKADYDFSNVVFDDYTFKYDFNGSEQIPTISNMPLGIDGAKLNVNYIKSGSFTEVGDIGSVTAKFETESINYNVPSDMTCYVNIMPKRLTINWDNLTHVYDGNEFKPSGELVGVISGYPVSIVFQNIITQDSGIYENISVDLSDNNHYLLDSDYDKVTYSILKATYDISGITYDKKIFEYNGKLQLPIPSNLPLGLEFDKDNSIGLKDVINNGKVVLKFINNNSNYNDIDDIEVEIVINPKKVIIVFDNSSFIYNGNILKPNCSIDGLVSGDIVSASVIDENVNVGNYVASVVLSSENYIVDSENSDLTYSINKNSYDMSGIVYDKLEFVYNGLYQLPNVSNLPSGVVYDKDNSIGLKDVTDGGKVVLKFINNNSNYNDIADIEVNIVINKKMVILSLDNNVFTYDGSILEPSLSISGVIDGDILNYNIVNESKNVGIYNANIELSSDNYGIDLVNSDLSYEIVKASFDVEYEVSGLSYTYDGLNHKPVVSKSSHYTLDGTLISYEILDEYKDCGTHSVRIKYSAGDNYNDKVINYDLVINKRTVTLSFETLDHEYDGYAFMPIVSKINNIIDSDNGELEALISVKSKDGKDIVEVGNYILVITLSGSSSNNYELSGEYEVAIYAALEEIDLSNVNIIDYNGQYDGLYHTVEVINLPDGITAITDGSYKDVCTNSLVTITFKSSDPNVGISNKAYGYVTITQKEVDIEFDQDEFVYNGSVQKPNGNIIGKVLGDDVNVIISTESINVGHYEATVSLDNSNYKIKSGAELSYDITECNVTLVWDNLDLIYEKKALKPSAYVKFNDKKLDINVVVTTATNNINVGTYEASASIADTNYIIDGSNVTNYNIIQREVGLNWYNYDLYYDGTELEPSAEVSVLDGDNCNVIINVEGEHIVPGNYKAIASLDNDNYKILGNDYYNYSISKGTLDESQLSSKVSLVTTVTYDGLLHYPNISGDNVYASDNSLIKWEALGHKNADNYNVDVIFKTDNNYYEEYIVNVSLRINQLELDIEFDSYEFEFDDSIKVPEVIVNNIISGDEISVTVTNKTVSIANNIKAVFLISGKDKGNYKITENYYYSIVKGTIDMSGVIYGNNLTYNGFTQLPEVSSLPDGVTVDSVNSIGVKNVNDNVATIVFSISEELMDNYKVPEAKVINVTVNKKVISVEFIDTVFGFDGLSHLPTYSLDGVINDDIVNLVFTDNGNINRGNYVAYANTLDNDNYQLNENVSVEYSIIIGNYDMSGITFNDKTFIYDKEVHNNVTISGNLPSGVDDIAVSVTYIYEDVVGAYKNVGTYKIIARFETESVNYNTPSDMECYVTINPREVQVSWSGLTFIYNGNSNQPSVASFSGLIAGDDLDYSLSGSGINAGSYKTTISINNDNYYITEETKSIDFVISKATYNMSEVIFENAQFTYDGNYHRQEVSGLTLVKGLDNSSPTVLEYVGDQIKNVSDGVVEITVYFTTESVNYEVPNPITRTLEITPKLLDVEVVFDGSVTSTKNEFSVDYDGKLHSFSVNYDSNDLVGNDQLTISLPSQSLAGNYNLNMEFSNDNYSCNNPIVKLTINTYMSYNQINWDFDSGKLYPDAYWTINGDDILLTTLGDGENNVYYRFYSSDKVTIIDEIPKETGYYYIEVVSDYSGLVINAWNKKTKFKLSYDSFKSSYDEQFTSDQVTYSGNADTKHSFTYDGIKYDLGLKLETSSGNVTITVSSNMTAYIFIGDVDKKVKVNGKSSSASDSNGIITVNLTSGTNSITKDNPIAVYLVFGEYIKLEQAWD